MSTYKNLENGYDENAPPPVYEDTAIQGSYQNHEYIEEGADDDVPPPQYPQDRLNFTGYKNLGFVSLDGLFNCFL
jgi:hypothetical protein